MFLIEKRPVNKIEITFIEQVQIFRTGVVGIDAKNECKITKEATRGYRARGMSQSARSASRSRSTFSATFPAVWRRVASNKRA